MLSMNLTFHIFPQESSFIEGIQQRPLPQAPHFKRKVKKDRNKRRSTQPILFNLKKDAMRGSSSEMTISGPTMVVRHHHATLDEEGNIAGLPRDMKMMLEVS